MQQRATYSTNRIDLFCRKWLGSVSDETRRQFIGYNYDWFLHSPTFWLPVGQLFWIVTPVSDQLVLSLQGRRLVIPPGEFLEIPSPGG